MDRFLKVTVEICVALLVFCVAAEVLLFLAKVTALGVFVAGGCLGMAVGPSVQRNLLRWGQELEE